MAVSYLTRYQAADFIRDHFGIPCTVHSLAKYAHAGTGPLYHRRGIATRYDPADITRWMEERTSKPMRAAREVRAPGDKPRGRPVGRPNAPKNVRPAPDQRPAA
jgi:hypothetical protein